MDTRPDTEREATELLRIAGGTRPALDLLMAQLNVLQSRAQLLLTLATLVLTITGFSGPKIAASSLLARVCLTVGLVLVLGALVAILFGGLRVRWVTQFEAPDDVSLIKRILAYRDAKTQAFGVQIGLLGAGVIAYVTGVVVYFITGPV